MKPRQLDVNEAEAALDLLVGSFLPDSTLHGALGVDAEVYGSYVESWLESTIAQGLSWIVTDGTTGEPAGCLLAVDYDAIQPSQPVPNATVTPPSLLPLKALLAELESAYDQVRDRDNRTVLVDVAVVAPGFRGQRIYRRLRESLHQHARRQAFTHVIGELSSTTTQREVIEHFEHTVAAEVRFATFEFGGSHPFAAIDDPAAIVLVEGDLRRSTAAQQTGSQPAG